jgi:hypothetical protein
MKLLLVGDQKLPNWLLFFPWLARMARTRGEQPFGDKLISAMRRQFDGHAVRGENE